MPVTLSEAGGLSGSGTTNYIPKWTPDGFTLSNSQIFDNGTNVGIGTSTPEWKLVVYSDPNNYATFGGPRPAIFAGSANWLQINGGNLGISGIAGVNGVSLTHSGISDGFLVKSDRSVGHVISNNTYDYMFKSFDSSSVNKFIVNHSGYAVNRLGVGVDPTATIHAKGSNSTGNPTDLCALFVNSSNAEILKLRNDKLVIFPSHTTVEKNAIVSPVAGSVVYDTTLNKLCVYTTAWETITSV